MPNLIRGRSARDFWIYVDRNNFLVKYNLKVFGGFSTPVQAPQTENLAFIPNPEFSAPLSPLQNNLVRNYIAEYNLEMHRRQRFSKYPSRLNSIFLLDSKPEAEKYQEKNQKHIEGRSLERVKTVGDYVYSKHDSSWIEFMRINHSMDDITIFNVAASYWQGETVAGSELKSMGEPWTQEPVFEVLFLGQIIFDPNS